MQLSFIKLHSFFTHKPISIQFLVKNCFYLIFELNLENGFHIGEMNLKISYFKPHLPIDLKIIFWPSFLLHNYFDAMIAFWFLRCLLWGINLPLSKMWFPNRYEKIESFIFSLPVKKTGKILEHASQIWLEWGETLSKFSFHFWIFLSKKLELSWLNLHSGI